MLQRKLLLFGYHLLLIIVYYNNMHRNIDLPGLFIYALCSESNGLFVCFYLLVSILVTSPFHLLFTFISVCLSAYLSTDLGIIISVCK